MNQPSALLDELSWRGLLYQQTEGLSEALSAGAVKAYAGFDPTAASLHVGSLVPVMGLVHLQRAGHTPVALVGGGTGMIGDPSGKKNERALNSLEVVQANAEGIRGQLAHFLDFSGKNPARMDNNARWLLELKAVDFMRDVGKHFTLNYMLAKESVDSRIQSGISYTEFSYMLLQAYDFYEMYRRDGVTLQIGGSDQWGNITAGIELIRKLTGGAAHGFTMPLVATSSGAKFGKTEAGAVWLDPKLTSPYRFFQFWINTDDADTPRFLRYFTLLRREEIEALDESIVQRPEGREAQSRLALEVTRTVHSESAARTAKEMSTLLFGGGDAASLSSDALAALQNEIPFHETTRVSNDADSDSVAEIAQLFVDGKLLPSKGAARRLLEQGGVYMNGQRVASDRKFARQSDLLRDGHLLLRKGSKDYLLVKIL